MQRLLTPIAVHYKSHQNAGALYRTTGVPTIYVGYARTMDSLGFDEILHFSFYPQTVSDNYVIVLSSVLVGLNQALHVLVSEVE